MNDQVKGEPATKNSVGWNESTLPCGGAAAHPDQKTSRMDCQVWRLVQARLGRCGGDEFDDPTGKRRTNLAPTQLQFARNWNP